MAEIRVPALGESVTEATIGKWFKQPGDAVAVDEPLVELETDKVTIEVPAPAAGVLGDIAAWDRSVKESHLWSFAQRHPVFFRLLGCAFLKLFPSLFPSYFKV